MSQDNNINSSAPSRASSASAPSIDTYTCKQLKIELRKRKLRVSGKKAELVDRLRKAMDSATAIIIRLKDQGGEEISFKMKRSTKMEKVFKHYAQRKGVTIRNLRFFLDGQRIASGDTASSLEMEDQDQIDVMLEQTGC
jgi:small ubiquitin-related modifier